MASGRSRSGRRRRSACEGGRGPPECRYNSSFLMLNVNKRRISVRRTSHLLSEPHCSPARVTKSAHEDSTRRDLAAGMHRVRSIRRELRVRRHPIVARSQSVRETCLDCRETAAVRAQHGPSCLLLRSSAAQRHENEGKLQSDASDSCTTTEDQHNFALCVDEETQVSVR